MQINFFFKHWSIQMTLDVIAKHATVKIKFETNLKATMQKNNFFQKFKIVSIICCCLVSIGHKILKKTRVNPYRVRFDRNVCSDWMSLGILALRRALVVKFCYGIGIKCYTGSTATPTTITASRRQLWLLPLPTLIINTMYVSWTEPRQTQCIDFVSSFSRARIIVIFIYFFLIWSTIFFGYHSTLALADNLGPAQVFFSITFRTWLFFINYNISLRINLVLLINLWFDQVLPPSLGAQDSWRKSRTNQRYTWQWLC